MLGKSWLSTCALLAMSTALSGCAFQVDESLGESTQALSANNSADRANLALHWAPIHYQDVDQTGGHALGGAADYLARYDFDGDLNAKNNWDRAGNAAYPLSAHAYFSVVETPSHWFIVYVFFHPRDWTDSFFDTEHENDAEGVMLSVQRDGSAYGVLKSAVTVAHTDFFSYLPSGSSWSANKESVDGTLSMASFGGSLHPVTAQEAKGHGLKARPYYDINGDRVVYYPSLSVAGAPTGPNDRNVSYKLVDIVEPGGMWDQRANTALFASFGSFAGDKTGGCGSGAIGCNTNSANAPWGWDDSNDGPGRGALATDPAGLASNYFKIPEGLDATYTVNPFR